MYTKKIQETSGIANGKPWENEYLTILHHTLLKKQKTCTMFLLSYRNTSGSLGEQEMLWEHKSQASVSTAISSSPNCHKCFSL